MYGGRLRKIKLKCQKQSLEAVLDRFPTGRIIKNEDNYYFIQAEVFGDGIEMWLRGQEATVVAIE